MADDDTELPPWMMGQLAAQDYNPDPSAGFPAAQSPPPPPPPAQPSLGADMLIKPIMGAAAARDYAMPSTPLDYAMYAMGPVGRVLGNVGKIGTLAAGAYGNMIGDAEAGKAGTAAKIARGVMGKALAAAPEAAEAMPATLPSSILRPNPIERYVTDPQRIYRSGIYQDPRAIAEQANAMVAPEHPALKQLFGVTRDDLYGISQQGTRQGNVAPNIWQPANPKGSYAAENIMNPANAQRLIDTLTEARKYPGLERGMVPWYVMDPAYQRLEQLLGPQRAVEEYNRLNMTMTPFSASSDVMKEINRGTAARMMADRGQYPDFVKYGGMPVEKRGADFPPVMNDVIPHLRHAPTHTDPVTKYLATGEHGYGNDTVKIPLYTQASGVPQTGFQTAWPVPDAHFTRAVGMSDVRKNAGPGDYMGGSEYRTFSPWFRQNVAQPLGLEGVPTQALTWGTYAPQTGVKTPIGAGKLELLSQRIWERAQRLGIDPAMLRDKVLLGQEHADLEDNQGMGNLAAQNRYA